MHIILKPEMRRHLTKIEQELDAEKIVINSKHPISNWDYFAREIYSDQIEASHTFAGEFESYLKLTKHFFGNSAILLQVNKEGNIYQRLGALDKFKSKFRAGFEENDRIIQIFLDVSKITDEKIGTYGFLVIKGAKDRVYDEKGRWDNFYFKYIHVPNPSEEAYLSERRIVEEEKVLEQIIGEDEWEQMKRLETMKYPIRKL